MPTIEFKSPYLRRQNRLRQAMQKAGIDALALNPGPSLTYLTGLYFHLMERPVVVLFTTKRPPTFVLPELEAGKTSNLTFDLITRPFGEDPQTWPGVFKEAVKGLEISKNARVGIEPRRLRVLELRLLESASPGSSFTSAEDVIAELRMHKDPEEISAMRQAVEFAQNALQATLPSIQIGMSEKDIAAELTLQLLRGGSESQLPFPPIIASGPNSANPHSVPSDRRLQPSDLLVIDWGASHQGYFSDLTRTFAVAEILPEFDQIAEVVADANEAGRLAARPGVPASTVDFAARNVIERSGFGEYFIHRTGHGLGMEEHEEPYIRGDNDQPLAEGMTFTVEPGIYLPNRGGVRIEDDIVITAQGSESLSDMPRDLRIVG